MQDVRPRALVADDDPRYRSSVCSALTALGWQTSAVNADPNSVAPCRGEFDVVVATIAMPSLRGRAMLQELANWPSETGVVAVGTPGTREHVLPALGGRARRFLASPFGRDGLNSAMTEVWEGRDEEHDATSAVGIDVGALARRVHADSSVLPTIAPITIDVQRLIGTPECGVDEILEVVSKDPAIAASILRLANSSRYRPRFPIKTLRSACMLLGNKRILALASEALLHDLFSVGRGPVQQVTAALWRHTVVKAQGARALAVRVGSVGPDEIQVAAMMCDLGELALLRLASQQHRDAPWQDEGFQRALAAGIHSHHEVVGALLLRSWQLESGLADLARHHHRPRPNARTREERTRHILVTAWAGASRAGYSWLAGQDEVDPSVSLRALGLSSEDLDEVFANANDWVEQD